MSSKPCAPAWFPQGSFPHRKAPLIPDLLLPCHPSARGRGLLVPQLIGQCPGFASILGEPPRWNPTVGPALKGFCGRPPPAQRRWAVWRPPNPRRTPERLAAGPRPGPRGSVLCFPSPATAAPASASCAPSYSSTTASSSSCSSSSSGAKRSFMTSWRQPVHGPRPNNQPPKMRALSGMASKTTSGAAVVTAPRVQPVRGRSFLQGEVSAKSEDQAVPACAASQKTTTTDVQVDENMEVGLVPGPPPHLGKADLYHRLRQYVLTEDQRKVNGYPFAHPERQGDAILFTPEQPKKQPSTRRVCCRCGHEYVVSSSSGLVVREEECCYHWGRLLSGPVNGTWAMHYSCCSAIMGSTGCRVAKQHVQDGRKENLGGFVKTASKDLANGAHPGIFALDCEMSYTTLGLELTRVTVVDEDMRVVYDTFVKPYNEIVDYNTKFSGVTEKDLECTDTTLQDVQAFLLELFSADTILIGHSLESDLLALKVIHSTVVDTALLFPHPLGFPYKCSLRKLMSHHLRQVIQANSNGHSSREDASACLQLVLWKVREDAGFGRDS
ncbi:exonuclease GOR-like [Thomomys bottae]